MRRPDLDQLDRSAADVEVEAAVERARRQRELDAVELEGAEEAPEQLADLAAAPAFRPASSDGGTSPISSAAAVEATISAPRDELVAVAVVAVGVRVDERGDRGARRDTAPCRRASPR